jgi:hypothetical protein
MLILRRMAIGLLALVLSAGPGWQSCATAYEGLGLQRAASANHAKVQGGHEDHQHSMTDKDTVGHHGSASDANGQRDIGPACVKCCGICMLISVIPFGPGPTPAQSVTHVIFASLIEQSHGRIPGRSWRSEACRLI